VIIPSSFYFSQPRLLAKFKRCQLVSVEGSYFDTHYNTKVVAGKNQGGEAFRAELSVLRSPQDQRDNRIFLFLYITRLEEHKCGHRIHCAPRVQKHTLSECLRKQLK